MEQKERDRKKDKEGDRKKDEEIESSNLKVI